MEYTITDPEDTSAVITQQGTNVGDGGRITYVYPVKTNVVLTCDADSTGDNYLYWIKVTFPKQQEESNVIESDKQLTFGSEYASVAGFDVTATPEDHNDGSSKIYGGNIEFTVAAGAQVEICVNWGSHYTINTDDGETIEVHNQNVDYNDTDKYNYTKETKVTIVCDPDNNGDNYFYWIKVTFPTE